MFPWSGEITVNVIPIMSGEGSEYFNYFFTIMIVFGLICFGFKILIRLVSRS